MIGAVRRSIPVAPTGEAPVEKGAFFNVGRSVGIVPALMGVALRFPHTPVVSRCVYALTTFLSGRLGLRPVVVEPVGSIDIEPIKVVWGRSSG